MREEPVEFGFQFKNFPHTQDQFQQLLDRLPAGAYICDSQGLITYFNQHAVRIWGRQPKLNDAADRYCGSFKLFAPDGNPIDHDECWMAWCLKHGREYNGHEIVIEREDGQRLTVLAHANPLRDSEGKILGAVNVLVDISDRKQAEQALSQLTEDYARLCEQLQESERRKDEFIAMLAHELRNPLAPICNAIQILQLNDDLNPATERVCEIMERQVTHIVRLVDDLLDATRIARGKIELRKELVDLVSVIRNVVEEARPTIDEARHQLAITLSPEPMMLDADPVRLTQVITNLLTNAVKYTPEGGQIWLSIRREDEQAVISVKDTGMGIPPEMLSQVFDMFAQVDRTLKRSRGGLGIGLTLAKNLVELHGGDIEAHSEGIGMGSEFIVRLPLAVNASAMVLPKPQQRKRIKAKSVRQILVVDDTHAGVVTLSKLLERMGQKVRTAHDAQTALRSALEERPDLVISDIAMPHTNGYELARRLRLEKDLEGITLVALTGYGREADKKKAKESGFDHHLVKPVSVQALQEILDSLPDPAPTQESRTKRLPR